MHEEASSERRSRGTPWQGTRGQGCPRDPLATSSPRFATQFPVLMASPCHFPEETRPRVKALTPLLEDAATGALAVAAAG